MWPWGHAAIGYLLYTGYVHGRGQGQPHGPAVILLALGTQFPDLVDKPLAWYVPVLPSGRSLGHSLLIGGLVVGAVIAFAHRRDRTDLGYAFGIGYLSHPLVDAFHPFIQGDWAFLSFLAWPLLPTPDYQGPTSILVRLTQLEPTPMFLFELLLTAIAIGFWFHHGRPGLETLHSWVRTRGHVD